jgi:Flp pilus assembly protein TadB
VGLEQAIPASLRAAGPSLHDPLARLVDRLHTRLPMPDALRRFADELDDPGADLIIAALIINARLRGPGLRDLLGALSASVREELDMRRKVNAERRSTRRSAQIVVGVSVGLALGLALFNRSYVATYDSPLGQLVLAVVVALYAGGFVWMRRLATFETPQRLLLGPGPARPDHADHGPSPAQPGARP